MSISKNLKKLLSMLTVVCMLFALIPATVSFAGTDDVVAAAQKLSSLPDSAQATILGELFKYAVSEADNDTLTAEAAVAKVESVLSDNKVAVIGDGAGQISEATLVTLAGKVIEYRPVFQSYYDTYKAYLTNDQIKTILGLSSTATELNVYEALLKTAVPFVKVNSAKTGFEKVSNFDSVVNDYINKLNLTSSQKVVATALIKDKASKIDELVAKINNYIADQKFTTANVNDLANILRDYNLCQAVQIIGGGGSVVVTPAPSTSPAPISTTIEDVTKLLDDALKAISSLDADKAADKAAEAITALSGVSADKLSLADEAALQAKAQDIVDAVMNKVTAQTVAPVVTGDTATAKVSDITSAINSIVAAADKLSKAIDASKLDVTLEKVLELNAQSGKDVLTSAVELPASVVEAAAKLDSVVLKTDVATVKIDPKDLGNGKDAVTITASKAAVPEEYKAVVGDNLAVDFSIKAGDKVVSNFSKPVTVTIPYTLKDGEDKNSITVFYVDKNGKLDNVAGYYDEAAKAVVFTTKHFSLYMVKANPVAFTDVNTGDWFKTIVDSMASKGIILGYADGDFKPENNITRAEFAALLVRGFKLSDDTATNSFSDIDSSDWFVNDVASAAKTGIVSGVGDGAFAPNENISRQDMAVMISRALKVVKNKSGEVVSTSTSAFKDYSSIDSYAQAGVASAAKYGIIKGMPDGTFAPKADATRAEAATMIYNLFFLK